MKKIKYLFTVLLAVILALGLVGCGEKAKVDLMDYISVEFSGIQEDGEADVDFDGFKMFQDISSSFSKKGASLEEKIKNGLGALGNVSKFIDSIDYKLDKEEKLENGDKVTVTISYDKELAKEAKVKIKGKTKKTFKVEGLKKAIKIDAFDSKIFDKEDGVYLEYSGDNEDADLRIQNQSQEEPYKYIYYEADKISDLKNGEEIVIKAELRHGQEEGYVLREKEKTIKVKGLPVVVTAISQLKEEDQKMIKDKLVNLLNQEAKGGIDYYHKNSSISSLYAKENFAYTEFKVKDYPTADQKTTKNYWETNTIIPFTLNFTAQPKTEWNGEISLSNEPIADVSVKGANGYFVIKNLKVDEEKNIIDKDNIKIELYGIFEDIKDMESKVYSRYGI